MCKAAPLVEIELTDLEDGAWLPDPLSSDRIIPIDWFSMQYLLTQLPNQNEKCSEGILKRIV